MTELDALKQAVSRLAREMGLPSVAPDWTGVDPVWPLLETMAEEGAVVVVKLDGQRPGNRCTVVSGGPLGEDYFHSESPTLEEGLAKAILFYAEKCWHHWQSS